MPESEGRGEGVRAGSLDDQSGSPTQREGGPSTRLLPPKAKPAHPHRAWERGGNENLNGLLRQYSPPNTATSTSSRRKNFYGLKPRSMLGPAND